MTEPSRLVVLAGPTAVGKGTIAAAVRREHPEVFLSVSATTRKPRPRVGRGPPRAGGRWVFSRWRRSFRTATAWC